MSPLHDECEVSLLQGFEAEDGRPADEGSVHLEERVLGRRSDERHYPGLDRR